MKIGCLAASTRYLKDSGEEVPGPAVLFNITRNDLRLTEELFGTLEKKKIERFYRIASGKEPQPSRAAPCSSTSRRWS